MRIIIRNSPNHSVRVHGDKAVCLVICHTPEGSYGPMVDYCCRSTGRRVSYHTILNESGTERTQLVPWHRKAWHAGAYNSLSDGVCAAGWASKFNVRSPQAKAFASLVAQRLVARDLPARWARNGGGKGFCRHGDIQSDRSDPMNLVKWAVFVQMVKSEYVRLKRADKKGASVLSTSLTDADWKFGRWYLGLGEFSDVGPRHRPSRPKGYPLNVSRGTNDRGWRAVRWYVRHTRG